MGPFDPNTLAGILGMASKSPEAMVAPLGMKPLFDTGVAPGFVGINGEGITGKELPGMEGLSKVPGHDTMMAAAQAGDGASLGLQGAAQQNPMAAILGMEALKALAAPPPQQQLPTISTGAAPRGQQIQLNDPSAKGRLDVSAPRRGMSGVLYGGK